MIERIFMLKLKTDLATHEQRSALHSRAKEELGAIPEVKTLHAGLPAGEIHGRTWDLSLVLHFEDMEALESYEQHPGHLSFQKHLEDKKEVTKVWDFVV